tara:strand:+ start:1603 stop:2859 length:1257 start_codon:yes stop_codon:yes gene_type:complete
MRSLAGTAGIFILGIIFSFIFNWSITKSLPQKEVGFFQYFISIITFAMVIVPMGYQSLAQREVINLNRNSIIRLSTQATIAIILGSIVFSFIWFFGVTEYRWVKDISDYSGLLVSIIIIPVYGLNIYFRAVLQGQNKIYSSIVPDVLIRPIILLSSLFFLPIIGIKINTTNLLWMLLVILIGSLIYKIITATKNTLVKTTNVTLKNNWFKQAIFLLPIGLLSTINERVDVVMVTKILGPESNAIYGVAFKFALFSGFGLVIFNQIMVPHYASYFKDNSDKENSEIQQKIKPNIRLAFALSTVIILVLMLLGEELLGWFGTPNEKYNLGYKTMLILSFGQLFNVAVGSTGYILAMAKKESLVLISIGFGLITNIVLNYLLVPSLKTEGAAIATSASIVVWNLMMLIFVKKETKINPTIF